MTIQYLYYFYASFSSYCCYYCYMVLLHFFVLSQLFLEQVRFTLHVFTLQHNLKKPLLKKALYL